MIPRLHRVTIIALAFICSIACAQKMAWVNNGLPLTTVAPGKAALIGDEFTVMYHHEYVVADETGGVFCCWTVVDTGDQTSPFLLRVQRIDRNGNALWGAAGVPVAPALAQTPDARQMWPQMVADGNGGVYLSWFDFSDGYSAATDMQRVQHIDAGGNTLWGDAGYALVPEGFTVVTQSKMVMPEVPQMESDGAGGAVIVFYCYRIGHTLPHGSMFAARISGTGPQPHFAWGPLEFSAADSESVTQNPMIVNAGADSAMVVLRVSTSPSSATDRIVLLVSGSTQWETDVPAAGLSDSTNAYMLGMISDGAGGVLISYLTAMSSGAGGPSSLKLLRTWGARVLRTGAIAYGPVELATAFSGTAVADGFGGMYVPFYRDFTMWAGGGASESFQSQLYLEHYDGTGAATHTSPSDHPGVHLGSDPALWNVGLVTDRKGNALCAWGDDKLRGYIVKMNRTTGAMMWDTTRLCDSAFTMALAPDGSDGAYAVWNDGYPFLTGAVNINSMVPYLQHAADSTASGVSETVLPISHALLRIAPQPVHDRAVACVTASGEFGNDAMLEVRDVLGRAVEIIPPQNFRSGTNIELNFTPLPAGVYEVVARSGKSVLQNRVVHVQ